MSGFTESRHEEGVPHDVDGAVGDEEVKLAWVNATVSASHDGKDGQGNKDGRRWTEGGLQAIGVASATNNSTDSSPSPTDDAIKGLQLQVDRDSAAQVFRTTPVALFHHSSGGGHACNNSDPPSSILCSVESLLEEFPSVIKLLTSGAPVEGDDGTMAGFAAVASDPSQVETPMISRNLSISPFQVGLYGSNSNLKSSEASFHAPASLKPPPPYASAIAGTPTTRRKSCRATKRSNKRSATRGTKPEVAETNPKARRKPSTPSSASSDASSNGQPPRKKRRVRHMKAKQDAKSGKLTVGPVGIDSSQMEIVNKMVQHMCQTTEDAKVAGDIIGIVEYCKEEHGKNDRAFAHLPGAIMDHLLEILEPEIVLRSFNLFRPSRPPSPASGAMPGASQEKKEHKSEPPRSLFPSNPKLRARQSQTNIMIVESDYVPNVIEAAVGFGFHLARLYPQSMDVDLHPFLAQGAVTVAKMTSYERMWLWKYLMNGGNRQPSNEMLHPQEQYLNFAPAQSGIQDAHEMVDSRATEYFERMGYENAYPV